MKSILKSTRMSKHRQADREKSMHKNQSHFCTVKNTNF